MKRKVCLIGQFPPPIHGLSIALERIRLSKEVNNKYHIEYVDIKENSEFLNHLKKINKIEADLYYFTISQTIAGNIRDMIILSIVLRKKKKVIIHYHGGYYKQLFNKMNILQKKINQNLLSKIDSMIVLSEGLKIIFSDVIKDEKIRICENFIEDSSLIDEYQFNKKMKNSMEKEHIDVLYLSNFIKSKGYLDVLESSMQLKGENIVFHFAGAFFSDDEKNAFFMFLEKNELENVVVYHGVVNGEAKQNLLQKCDVFILPTYYPKEGQPISIIEAMGNGLTVVTTNHAGIPDIVKDSNGFIVNPQSHSEITKSIKVISNNRSIIPKIGNHNRRIVLDKYKENDYIERLIKIFGEVLNNES